MGLVTAISATWMLMTSIQSPAQEQASFERSIHATRQLLESREYDLALLSLQQARLLLLNDEQRAAIALYEGMILSDLGRQQEARAASAFMTALLVAPLTQLPVEASARVERAFEAVRARVLKGRSQRARPLQAPSPQDSVVLVPAEFESGLNTTRGFLEDQQYAQALKHLQRVRRWAVREEERTTVALYEGLILANLGQQQQVRAASAFTTALQLDPEAQLPIKTLSQVERAFEESRAHVVKDLAYRPPTVAPSPAPQLNVAAPEHGTPLPRLLGPAIFGGGLLISGGVFWGLARNEQSWLRRANPIEDSLEGAELHAERRRAYQEMGFVLMGTGAVVIGAAASLHWLRKPELTLALGVGTKGTSISACGRWR